MRKMPALYRSKSVRRFDEVNCRITSIIEKDNNKVLATAAVQLFISTPQLEKWFKSSTGTICFLKDLTRKNFFYFRLYSLMQGQLWEQEMQSPFIYKKLSPIFHYLTVNRFNFGFKFICEDEAERFFVSITKVSLENDPPSLVGKTQQAHSLMNTTINSTGHSLVSQHVEPSPTKTRLIRRHLSATPQPSYNLIANLKTPAGSSPASANLSQSGSVSNTSLTVSMTTIKPANEFVSPQNESSSSHKSRKPEHSIERKKKIEKSDISCPFRCYFKLVEKEPAEKENKSPNEPEKSFLRPRSSGSFSKVSLRSTGIQEVNGRQTPTSIVSSIASSSSSSLNSSPSLNSKTRLVKEVNYKLEASTMVSKKNQRCDYESLTQNKEDLELEATKEILIKYNVPINKTLVNALKGYISQYGSVEKFQNSLKSESERNKFNSFVASTSAAYIAKVKNRAVPNPYVDIHNTSSSPKQNKYQASMPPNKNVLNNSISPSTPLKAQFKQVLQPTTPNPIKASLQRGYNISSYQSITPGSATLKNANIVSAQPPIIPQSERTPVRMPSHLVNSNRTQTPSPSRNSYQFRQHLTNTASITPSSIDANAPPKPPRRSSLKMAT